MEAKYNVVKDVLITLSGLDGSGKSTISNEISKLYESKELRHISIINFRILNKLSYAFRNNKSTKNKHVSSNYVLLFNSLSLILDIFIFKINYNLFQKNKIVICDRYFYDLLISIKYRHGKIPLFNFITNIIDKPDFSFLIKVNPKIAQSREKDDKHQMQYFNEKNNLYIKTKEKFGFTIIDNNLKISTALASIKEKLIID